MVARRGRLDLLGCAGQRFARLCGGHGAHASRVYGQAVPRTLRRLQDSVPVGLRVTDADALSGQDKTVREWLSVSEPKETSIEVPMPSMWLHTDWTVFTWAVMPVVNREYVPLESWLTACTGL